MRDWEQLVPRGVAIQQQAWELNQRVLRAHQAGMSRAKIAEWLGVSYQMARIRVLSAQRGLVRRSPVERYLGSEVVIGGFTRPAARSTVAVLGGLVEG